MAETRSSTSSAMMTSRSSASAPSSAMHSSSSASSSRPAMTPSRRSMAHTPRLLLREDGEIPLHGLGISSAASEHFPTSARSARAIVEEDLERSEDERFRLDEEDDIETFAKQNREGQHLAERPQEDLSKNQPVTGIWQNRKRSATLLAPIRIVAHKLADFQAEQGEDSAMMGQEHDKGLSGDDTIDLELNGSAKHTPNNYAGLAGEEDTGHEPGYTARLYFEPVTAREKIWMIISVAFVSLLTAVAIAISVNWIDWPNDGIGKD